MRLEVVYDDREAGQEVDEYCKTPHTGNDFPYSNIYKYHYYNTINYCTGRCGGWSTDFSTLHHETVSNIRKVELSVFLGWIYSAIDFCKFTLS